MRSLDLEHQLSSKERELEGLFQKQKTVSSVCPRGPGDGLTTEASLSLTSSWSFSAAS